MAATTLGRDVRPEIQALRAGAVLLVLVYHLWPDTLRGGFVGVPPHVRQQVGVVELNVGRGVVCRRHLSREQAQVFAHGIDEFAKLIDHDLHEPNWRPLSM